FQICSHFRSSLVSKVTVLLDRLPDDLFQLRRYSRVPFMYRNWGLLQDGIVDDRCCVAAERTLPGGHLVEDQAKGKQVGARVNLFPSNLLRRHVAGGAHRRASPSEMKICRGLKPAQRRKSVWNGTPDGVS